MRFLSFHKKKNFRCKTKVVSKGAGLAEAHHSERMGGTSRGTESGRDLERQGGEGTALEPLFALF